MTYLDSKSLFSFIAPVTFLFTLQFPLQWIGRSDASAAEKEIKLAITGGGETDPLAIQEIIEAGGGKDAKVFILSLASEERQIENNSYLAGLATSRGVPVEHIYRLPFTPLKPQKYQNYAHSFRYALSKSTVILMSGGSQTIFQDFMHAHPDLNQLLIHKILDLKTPTSVTSATAAMLGPEMLTGDSASPYATGWNLLKKYVRVPFGVETHLIEREWRIQERDFQFLLDKNLKFLLALDRDGTAMFRVHEGVASFQAMNGGVRIIENKNDHPNSVANPTLSLPPIVPDEKDFTITRLKPNQYFSSEFKIFDCSRELHTKK